MLGMTTLSAAALMLSVTFQFLSFIVMLSVVMLCRICYCNAECHVLYSYAECLFVERHVFHCYAECRYAESCYAESRGAS